MGITQKSLAHGVPVVAVPFGRDQPEVARESRSPGPASGSPHANSIPPGSAPPCTALSACAQAPQRIAAAFAAAGGPTAAADVLEQLTPTRR
jgi:UDP:flavonoid glycosyltransferase YjiC (YdhE family)